MSKSNGQNGKLVVMRPDGTEETFHFKPGHRPSYETLQALVGGMAECVKVTYQGRTREAYVDEDGRMKGLRFNRFASVLYGRPIVGAMVVWVP